MANEIWNLACERIRERIGLDQFTRLIKPMIPISFDNNTLMLQVDNPFIKEWITTSYLSLMRDAVRLVSHSDFAEVGLVVSDNQEPLTENPPPAPVASNRGSRRRRTAALTTGIEMNPEYTFSNFVMGPSNSFSYSAARGVVNKPGRTHNPLFIYGETGMGKTHLMQAIGHEVQNNTDATVCYTTTESLLNNYLDALRNRTTADFRRHYRTIDILLIDDIHFMARSNSLQEEFFNMFNTLQNNRKQIVMTSDRAPGKIEGLEDRLVSRFQGGLITSIERPDYETRFAILKSKQENADTKIPEYLLSFIAENVRSNVRTLEGALTRVQAHVAFSRNRNEMPTVDETRRLLSDILNNERLPDLTFSEIQRKVGEHYGVSVSDMMRTGRAQNIAYPRQVAMFLCRKLTRASLPEIARAFEKTHATILHACNTVKGRMSIDSEQASKIETIVEELGRDPNDLRDA